MSDGTAPSGRHEADSLRGKAIVVTGGGRGLGAAYCVHAGAAGAAVVVNDIDAERAREVAEAIVAAGGSAAHDNSDVGRQQGARDLVAGCVARFGRIDGLVNNAGVISVGPPWDEDADVLESMVRVNVLGSLFCGIDAMRQMIRQRSGSIVNITSGAQAGAALMAAYGATKGAIASLTYGWALDLLSFNIRVNAVAPSAATRMIAYARERGAPVAGHDHAPEDAAPLITYLLSDASADVTGQVFRFRDGALSVMRRPEVTQPVVSHRRWSFDAVKQAFDGELRGSFQPLQRHEHPAAG